MKRGLVVDESHHGMTLATLEAMLRQEQRCYTPQDFISIQKRALPMLVTQNGVTRACDPMDVSCRTKMCTWFEQICTFCHYDDESESSLVEIAMNYLDRFIGTKGGSMALLDRYCYQLAAITCLYIAIKIHASSAMSIENMAVISRGTYTVHQIEDMEGHVLSALQWRVNPPTTSSFVDSFVQLLLTGVELSQQESEHLKFILDLTQQQIKLATIDYSLITTPSSIIAYAALMNAFAMAEVRGLSMPLYAIRGLLAESYNLDLDSLDHRNVLAETQEVLYIATRKNTKSMTSIMASRLSAENLQEHKSSFVREEGCPGEISPRSSTAIAISAVLLNQS
jgi:hypothetical protein